MKLVIIIGELGVSYRKDDSSNRSALILFLDTNGMEVIMNTNNNIPTHTHTPTYSVCTETGLRVCEIRLNLLVRTDGLVRNINHSARNVRKEWHIGSKGTKGYRLVQFNGKSEKAHRLIAEAFIENPNNLPQINHINHNPSDNRVENLEYCTQRYNSSNKKIHLTKLVGVGYCKRRAHLPTPWVARIQIDGKQKHLGYFATEQLAHNAYLEALALL